MISPSPTLFESPTYWYRSPHDQSFAHGCGMWSTIFFLFHHLCTVEFEVACEKGNKFMTSMRIPNRHFPTWKIKGLPPLTFAAAPHLFPIPSAYNRQTPRIDHASGLEIRCLLRWRMHSTSSSTRISYISLNPIGRFDPRFLCF